MSNVLKLRKYLILPDAHCPYHDRMILEDLIIGEVLPRYKPYGVIILGDWFDNYSISRFVKNPTRLRGLQKELEIGFKLLKPFEDCGAKDLVFIEGNHENRLPKFLAERAPEVYEIVLDWWAKRFKEWKYVQYMEDTTIGKLFITHDVGRCGEHSTKQSLHDYQDNVVIGHNHLLDYIVRANAHGKAHVGASFGWLGDTDKIDYRHRMKCRKDWVHGMGTMVLRDDGIVHVTPHPVVKKSVEIDGVIYRV